MLRFYYVLAIAVLLEFSHPISMASAQESDNLLCDLQSFSASEAESVAADQLLFLEPPKKRYNPVWPEGSIQSISNSDYALKNDWLQLSRDVMHQMVGDDSRAYLGFLPQFKVSSSYAPNAFALAPNQLIVSQGLLSLIEKPSELAFVIAHELAHFLLGHSSSMQNSNRSVSTELERLISNELEADRLALEMLKNSEFDPSAARLILSRIGSFRIGQNSELKEVFPSISKRLESINAQLKLAEPQQLSNSVQPRDPSI